jgi:hypothetical protein
MASFKFDVFRGVDATDAVKAEWFVTTAEFYLEVGTYNATLHVLVLSACLLCFASVFVCLPDGTMSASSASSFVFL